jgi:DNA-binding HxlR family transcriptional regulator
MEHLMDKPTQMGMIQAVTDAIYVINGKWKLPILICLSFENMRFGEIANNIPNITDRMLSKELRELEANLLVKRAIFDSGPVKIEYSLTDHGRSLHDVIIALHTWGVKHRKVILNP